MKRVRQKLVNTHHTSLRGVKALHASYVVLWPAYTPQQAMQGRRQHISAVKFQVCGSTGTAYVLQILNTGRMCALLSVHGVRRQQNHELL